MADFGSVGTGHERSWYINQIIDMRISLEDLLASGAHFWHLTRRWNPKMKPYIFMERNGIHIIDLKKTQALAEEALNAAEQMAAEGKKFLFVATKKQLRA